MALTRTAPGSYRSTCAEDTIELGRRLGACLQEGDVLVISQVKAGATVSVYALDGKLIRQLTAPHAGTYRLNLSELPAGLYLVKADNVTYKIVKR
jgi:sugar lactone lactonase YvrE